MFAQTNRTLLILDLDETLIHARATPLDRKAEFEVFGYHVYLRPHLTPFLLKCAGMYEMAVWSSASDDYVTYIVEKIFPKDIKLHFVWGRSRATLSRAISGDDDFWHRPDRYHLQYIKPLKKVKKLGWPLSRMLIVDDTPRKCIRNYGNAIYPAEFEGSPEDQELLLLGKYLETLKDVENVRHVEKRTWRQKVENE